jgi:hypothetical protein
MKPESLYVTREKPDRVEDEGDAEQSQVLDESSK